MSCRVARIPPIFMRFLDKDLELIPGFLSGKYLSLSTIAGYAYGHMMVLC